MLSRGVEIKRKVRKAGKGKKETDFAGEGCGHFGKEKKQLSREFALLWLSASIEPVSICFVFF